MGVTRYDFEVTTDAAGAGTVTSRQPLRGEVLEVRHEGAHPGTLSGTATYTITRSSPDALNGGTVLAYTATANPWSISPRQAVHSVTGGTTAYALGIGPVTDRIPVDDYLKLVVANGGSVVTDIVSVWLGK